MAVSTLSTRADLNITPDLAGYDASLHEQLMNCARQSSRVAQLAHIHPYLFLGLACRTVPAAQQRIAIQQAIDGAPLARICETMNIPVALRHIPAHACITTPSPAAWSRAAERTLAANVPATSGAARRWLHAITLAHHLCDERFALWVARQPTTLDEQRMTEAGMVALAVYAWNVFHGQLPTDVAASLRWTPRQSLKTMVRKARHWHTYCCVELMLGTSGVSPWIAQSTCGGYDFVPLNTAEQLYLEAVGMKNCVMSYSKALMKGECRLFGIRRAGAHAATVEIRYIKERDYLAIVQMKGWGNGKCPDDAAIAARDWIMEHRNNRPLPQQDDRSGPDIARPDRLANYRQAKASSRFGYASIDLQMLHAGLVSLDNPHRLQLPR